ncbi:hypothetical protein CVIRNUC_002132 [Coccomyxa viridis]|uniref:Uncharacterized protein n=1 Tax=Coccomyxa viridis TaxID=1274662 RepID=A0AAV1HXM0_9CHLO|nr:hypothetical protein CVIRNUC_002132 [Coccomyxa viridis]
MTDSHQFEIFIHQVAISQAHLQRSETIFEIELADFEPLHIFPRALSAAAPPVDCVISLKPPDGTHAPVGKARMRLHTQHAPSEALRPIWQQRPQALPLQCPATGMQTGLVCVSARLVHLLPRQRKAELSQTTCSSSAPSCSQSERTGSEIPGNQEDILRAALHDFAMPIA